MKNIAKVFIGVDVSKDTLDIHIYPINKSFKVKNTKAALKAFITQLKCYNVQQVVFESSGGYECFLIQAIQRAGYKMWQVDPKRIKAFIISEGIKAKTDAIDAKMIAMFASQKTCKYQKQNSSKEGNRLKELFTCREDLIKMITMEKNRQSNPSKIYSKKYLQQHINFMEKQLAKIEKEINEILANNNEWKKRKEIIESVPGIGPVSSMALLSKLPELGTVNKKQIAALVGVAPYTRQSGKYKGMAKISGGRHGLRHVLYMSALVASKHNPKLRLFYKKLIKAEKKPLVALTAVMRRLIVILNSMVMKEEKWNPDFV